MNKFQYTLTSEGNHHFIFDKAVDITTLFLPLLAKVTMLGVTAELLPSDSGEASNKRAKKRGRKPRDLTEYQRQWEDQRVAIRSLVGKVGMMDYRHMLPDDKWSTSWEFAYYLLERDTGYSVGDKGARLPYGDHGKSKINKVLKDGRGSDLIRSLNAYIKEVDCAPRLTLTLTDGKSR
ncbi:hypothetical protein ACT3XG_14965 [Paenibacillus polymyxa]|uniref:hypothetical protein n=1 Tax=Paenibacillus TaxID=44249 RepID=UPI00142D236A|nr:MULTISPECIES: hypothetical protein [Paenibacillus]KAF6658922.1 hypothetical protein HFD99_01540 [Paenibacillus sp. EKM301P]UBS85457.1 hypothetical protein LAZ93_14920 [Paenibacillus polymyxa]WHX33975.1 hypothetical protein QNH38_15400 [Paenibacillus polymyxa]